MVERAGITELACAIPNTLNAERFMLIDLYLPEYDVAEVVDVEVDALPTTTYAAIREADLVDPVIRALFAARELPSRIASRLSGATPSPESKVAGFERIAGQGPEWVLLDERPGREFLAGAIGRFWQSDYGSRPVRPDEFTQFDEPGYAKLATHLAVREVEGGGSVLRYEIRTATTDDTARRRFRWYWRTIRPGVGILMRRTLQLIKTRAEGEQRRHPLLSVV